MRVLMSGFLDIQIFPLARIHEKDSIQLYVLDGRIVLIQNILGGPKSFFEKKDSLFASAFNCFEIYWERNYHNS